MSKELELDDRHLDRVSGGIPSTLPETQKEQGEKRDRERAERADIERRKREIRENSREIQKDFERQLRK